MLDYEIKADPAEKKLIKRVKDQVKRGRIALSVHEAKNESMVGVTKNTVVCQH